MITFEVSDMTCGHCASTITKALKGADPDARVAVDVGAHRVQVEPAKADEAELIEAIKDAGYTPVVVAQPTGTLEASGKKGCCCG